MEKQIEERIEKQAAGLDRLQRLLESERVMRRTAEAKLEKAEHDRDRYARKIEELTAENERLMCESAKQYVDAVDARAPIVRAMRHKLMLEYSDCMDEETVCVASIRASINDVAEEVLYNVEVSNENT